MEAGVGNDSGQNRRRATYSSHGVIGGRRHLVSGKALLFAEGVGNGASAQPLLLVGNSQLCERRLGDNWCPGSAGSGQGYFRWLLALVFSTGRGLRILTARAHYRVWGSEGRGCVRGSCCAAEVGRRRVGWGMLVSVRTTRAETT